jgi:hypothetical protein
MFRMGVVMGRCAAGWSGELRCIQIIECSPNSDWFGVRRG